MKNILIIGGTRNMGFDLTQRLLAAGHTVTILNRGLTPDTLPQEVHRLRADRTDSRQLHRALMGKTFDVVVDFALYKEPEAQAIVQFLSGQVGHYVFISTGQVYLIREKLQRPFSEEDYAGRLQPEPKENTFAHEEWLYGMDKRRAEDVFWQAHRDREFPITVLRMPMVNSEYDQFGRLYSYVLRLQDGGPLLIPETPNHPLRHVYKDDVVTALKIIIENGVGKGRAYNISQDETVMIDEFLEVLGEIVGTAPDIVRVEKSWMEANGFLPHASPFSERWMSELTNERSKAELKLVYTPLRQYLAQLVAYFDEHKLAPPIGYKRRQSEIKSANDLRQKQ